MGGLLGLVYREGDWAGPVPVTVLLYNGPLLCDFNVPIKGLNKNFALRIDSGPPPVRLCGREHKRTTIVNNRSERRTQFTAIDDTGGGETVVLGLQQLV